MEVRFHPGAAAELDGLPVQERLAIEHAIEKLQVCVQEEARSKMAGALSASQYNDGDWGNRSGGEV